MQLDRLELKSGGWVEFRDSEELNGEEYEALKAHMMGSEVDTMLAMQRTMAAFLIDRLEIPYAPKIVRPRDRGGAACWRTLKARDVHQIDQHVIPAIIDLFFTADDDPKDEPSESVE